jgi:hypothetical protein
MTVRANQCYGSREDSIVRTHICSWTCQCSSIHASEILITSAAESVRGDLCALRVAKDSHRRLRARGVEGLAVIKHAFETVSASSESHLL